MVKNSSSKTGGRNSAENSGKKRRKSHKKSKFTKVLDKIFGSFWARMTMSFLGIIYLIIVGILAYRSVYYSLIIPDAKKLLIIEIVLSLIFLAIMLYSRKQLLTIIISIALMVLIAPLTILWFGHWVLLVPIMVLAVTIFVLSGATEQVKVYSTALLILLYLFSATGYYLVTSLFVPHIYEVTTVTDFVSQSGKYRAFVEDAPDSTAGTNVYIEPNDRDIDNGLLKFRIKGYQHKIYVNNDINRKDASKIKLVWATETRENCVSQILAINNDTVLELNRLQYAVLGIKYYTTTKDSKGKDVQTKNPIYLKDLTSQQLDILGVPKTGDIFLIDDKVQFRYIIAVMERYFDTENRELFFN